MLISVVIPVHNEAGSLCELVARLSRVVTGDERNQYELLIVDDASTDESPSLISELSSSLGFLRPFRLARRGGQTGCYALAFSEARGEFIVRMDGDLQDSPEDLPRFVLRMQAGYDLIVGRRVGRKHQLPLRVASTIFDWAVRLLFASPLRTHAASFVAFRRTWVRNVPFQANDHRYLPLIALRRGATKVCHLEVLHRARQWGRSKYSMGRKILGGIPEVLHLFFRLKRGFYDITPNAPSTSR